MTQCHPELACLAAIGTSVAGLSERASAACWESWCEGSCGGPRMRNPSAAHVSRPGLGGSGRLPARPDEGRARSSARDAAPPGSLGTVNRAAWCKGRGRGICGRSVPSSATAHRIRCWPPLPGSGHGCQRVTSRTCGMPFRLSPPKGTPVPGPSARCEPQSGRCARPEACRIVGIPRVPADPSGTTAPN
jgi:hypothetical protein